MYFVHVTDPIQPIQSNNIVQPNQGSDIVQPNQVKEIVTDYIFVISTYYHWRALPKLSAMSNCASFTRKKKRIFFSKYIGCLRYTDLSTAIKLEYPPEVKEKMQREKEEEKRKEKEQKKQDKLDEKERKKEQKEQKNQEKLDKKRERDEQKRLKKKKD